MEHEMQLRKFVRDDWSWVQAWFQDDLLNRELGPLDRAWLEHVLVDADGVQLVAMEGDAPSPSSAAFGATAAKFRTR